MLASGGRDEHTIRLAVFCVYCMFDLSVYYMYLQYFDTVGWVF